MLPATSSRRSRDSRSGLRSTARDGRVTARPPRDRAGGLCGDLHPAPERDAVADLLGRLLGGGVVPGRVGVALAVDDDVEVARLALPGARRLLVGALEVLLAQRLAGEVVVALDDDGVVALGQDGVVPDRLHGHQGRNPPDCRVMTPVLPVQERKRIAAEAAAELVEDGMRVGLGTGSTVAPLLPALARRGLSRVRCVATSPRTAALARELGLAVEEFDSIDALDRLDLAIDGADQVAPDWWVVKGGGGAHTREKVVASAAERFVVIVSDDKLVPALAPPVPVELLAFGHEATLRALGDATVREGWPQSPDGGVIADLRGPVGDPAALAARLVAVPGVVEHGLFAPAMTAAVIVGGPDGPARLASPDG